MPGQKGNVKDWREDGEEESWGGRDRRRDNPAELGGIDQSASHCQTREWYIQYHNTNDKIKKYSSLQQPLHLRRSHPRTPESITPYSYHPSQPLAALQPISSSSDAPYCLILQIHVGVRNSWRWSILRTKTGRPTSHPTRPLRIACSVSDLSQCDSSRIKATIML